MLVGFSEFQSNDYADAGYAFRSGTDPPGTMGAPVTLKDGEGPYVKRREDDRNRWGDYSATQVDPSDDLTLWTIQEYARIPVGRGDQSGRWGTWWGRVGGGAPLARPLCLVPRVVGKRLDKAWHQIAAAHCRLGIGPPGQGDQTAARPGPPPVPCDRHPPPQRHEGRPARRPLASGT